MATESESYRDGKLTRIGMERVIASGGSIIHEGTVINTLAQLPSAGSLAKASGDNSEVNRVLKEKQDEIEKLKAEIGELRKPVESKPESK